MAAIDADIEEIETTVQHDAAEFEKDVDDTIEGDINAAKENARLAKERRESKINAIKLNARMKADVLKEKFAQRNDAKDKVAMESYIIDLLDYAECCQQVAFTTATEADMALLEAAQTAAEYKERFGEEEEVE